MHNIPQPLNLDQSVRLWEMSLFSFQGRRFGGSVPRARLGQGVLGPQVAPAARGCRGDGSGEPPTPSVLVPAPWHAATHSTPPFLNLPTMFSSMSAESSGLQDHVQWAKVSKINVSS